MALRDPDARGDARAAGPRKRDVPPPGGARKRRGAPFASARNVDAGAVRPAAGGPAAGAAQRSTPAALAGGDGQRGQPSQARRWLRFSALQWALLVSLGVHAALGVVHFVAPQAIDRVFQDTPLEVILVNARSREAPVKAQAIAQAQLAGGGEAEQGRATSPLPPAPTVQIGDAADDAKRRIDALQDQQQQLLAQMRRDLAALPPPDPRRDNGTPLEREQEDRRRQLLRLLAEIEKRINEENARPKKRYISPATREEVYALYYDGLRRRIEDRGTRDFPQAQGRKLYGELTMNVTVDALGRVIDTEIVRPSASRQLDQQAVAIVRAASPFGPFTAAMRRQADQIVVTSRFRFTREDGLETTLSAR